MGEVSRKDLMAVLWLSEHGQKSTRRSRGNVGGSGSSEFEVWCFQHLPKKSRDGKVYRDSDRGEKHILGTVAGLGVLEMQ